MARSAILLLLIGCYQHHEPVAEVGVRRPDVADVGRPDVADVGRPDVGHDAHDAADGDAARCEPIWRDELVATGDGLKDVDVAVDDAGRVSVVWSTRWSTGTGVFRAESPTWERQVLENHSADLVAFDPSDPSYVYAFLRTTEFPEYQIARLDGETTEVLTEIDDSLGARFLTVSPTSAGPVVAFRANEVLLGWTSMVDGVWNAEEAEVGTRMSFPIDARATRDGTRIHAFVRGTGLDAQLSVIWPGNTVQSRVGNAGGYPYAETLALHVRDSGGVDVFTLAQPRERSGDSCAVVHTGIDGPTAPPQVREVPVSCPQVLTLAADSSLHVLTAGLEGATHLEFVPDGSVISTPMPLVGEPTSASSSVSGEHLAFAYIAGYHAHARVDVRVATRTCVR